MSAMIYCSYCSQASARVVYLQQGETRCSACGRTDLLRCSECNELIMVGLGYCARCSRSEVAVVRGGQSAGAMVPDLPSLEQQSLSVPAVPTVVERYSGGRYGIKADVVVPAGDVALMNELGSLVSVLHLVASRLNHFTILTDHTRKLIRDMRVLATDAQEEIETRRGPA